MSGYPYTRSAASTARHDRAMVADYGHGPGDDQEPTQHARQRSPQIPTSTASPIRHTFKTESPSSMAMQRNDSPAPHSSARRNQAAAVDGTPAAPSRGSASKQDSVKQQSEHTPQMHGAATRRTTKSLGSAAEGQLAALELELREAQLKAQSMAEKLRHAHAAQRHDTHDDEHARERQERDKTKEDDAEGGAASASDDDEHMTEDEELATEQLKVLADEMARIKRTFLTKPSTKRSPSTKPLPPPPPPLMYMGGQYEYLRGLKELNSAEIEKYSFEPNRTNILTAYPDALQHLGKKHPTLDEWINLLDKDETEAKLLIKARPDLGEADRYMQTCISQLIAKKSEEGQLFADQERALYRNDKARASSGLALANRLKAYEAVKTLKDAKKTVKAALDKNKLAAGMTENKCKVKLNRLLDAHHELPPKYASAIDPMQLLLEAIPTGIMEDSSRSYAQRLSDEMDEHLSLYGTEKFTTTALRNAIALRMSTVPAPSNVFVATTTKKKPDATGTAGTGDARAKRLAGTELTGTVGIRQDHHR